MSHLTLPTVGGFGNQLFIIAAGMRLKDLFDSDLKFLLLENSGTSLRPSYWKTFFTDCPQIQEVLVFKLPDVVWAKLGANTPSDTFIDRTAVIEENRRNNISTSYEGYFQNWRYLPPKGRIFSIFNIPEKKSSLAARLGEDFSTTCSIHFRLGDYKTLSQVHPMLSNTYYRRAIQTVMQGNPLVKNFLIFVEKEDEETVKTRLQSITADLACEVRFASKFELQDWEEVILQSLCGGGNIIANSSFSWWGAFFNENGQTIYPSKWTNGELGPPEFSLAQPSWIQVTDDGTVIESPRSGSSKTEICVDVGSHDGADSLKMHSLYPSAKVIYGFEPHPRFYGVTVQNTKLFRKIENLPYAVSDSTEKFITLNESRGDQSHSILPFKHPKDLEKHWPGCYALYASGRSFTVRLTRLDDFFDSRGYSPETLVVLHLHVDAQGVDLEVLRSLGKYLHCVKSGVVEAAKTDETSSYQGQQGTIATVKSFLQENGFTVDAVKPNDINEEISCEFNIYFSRK